MAEAKYRGATGPLEMWEAGIDAGNDGRQIVRDLRKMARECSNKTEKEKYRKGALFAIGQLRLLDRTY